MQSLVWRSNTYNWRTAWWLANPVYDGSAELVSWLQHRRKSRESYVGGAPLLVTVRDLVASEGAVIDSLHQAQASGDSRQARTRAVTCALIGFQKEIPPRSLASGLRLQRTTNGLREVYIERLRRNETLRRPVLALRLERYDQQIAVSADRSLTTFE